MRHGLLLILSVVLFAGLFPACASREGDDDDSDDGVETSDDAVLDDDASDDDVVDDADDHEHFWDDPFILYARYEPDEFTWTPECETTPCAYFRFALCDRSNNMFPDGGVLIDCDGCTTPAFGPDPSQPISDYFDPSTDFSDCGHPAEAQEGFMIDEDAFPVPGTFTLYDFIQAWDTEGNISNIIGEISLTIHYEG